MSVARPELEIPHPAPVPRLLVELPSWSRTFFANLRDVIFPRRLAPLELRSAPAPFWHDVFVQREFPWSSLFQSIACHAIAFAVLIVASRIIALQPQVAAQPVFDHSQVIYYQPSEYLPPLDTRSEKSAEPRKADAELARQPIISVPREADNREQTIVTPPSVKLKQHVAMPNIVAWSDQPKPKLDIPAAPLTPAAQISRMAPQLDVRVAAPPQDIAAQRRSMTLQNQVVAPPTDLRSSRTIPKFDAPEPSVVAPPPTVAATTRTLGDIDVGHANVINPAPQLYLTEQRAIPGGRSSSLAAVAPQVVAPPPSLGGPATGGATSSGTPGRVIALNLHPEIGAPPAPPPGNRRGSFAASPSGHTGATGSPGEAAGTPSGSGAAHGGNGNGLGSNGRKAADLPSGLYVGNASANTSPVAGDPGPTKSATSPVAASINPPRVTTAPKPLQPGNPAKLSEAERAIFGGRKFYSMSLNMPNLNSVGGSWLIRFAELRADFDPHTLDQTSADLSQPTATRKVDPAYPMQLMRENVSGTVILYAVIHADGNVGNVRVLRGVDDRLDQFAKEAVAQWKFDPATKDGKPVDVEATFQIPFKPSKQGSPF